jgi:hypothetical protein
LSIRNDGTGSDCTVLAGMRFSIKPGPIVATPTGYGVRHEGIEKTFTLLLATGYQGTGRSLRTVLFGAKGAGSRTLGLGMTARGLM